MSNPLLRYRPTPHSAEIEAPLSQILDAAMGGTSGQVLTRGTEVWHAGAGGGGGSGTVTTLSVASANGFAGTVANATTTPAITLTTSVTGILIGNGTAISAVTIGTGLDLTGSTLTAPGGGSGTVTSVAAGTGLTGGTITSTGTIALDVPVTVAHGGTGLTTLTNHAVLLGASASVLGAATVGTAGRVLIDNGSGADPTFSSTGIVIATHIAPMTVDTPGSTVTFDLGVTDWHQVTLGQATTFALSNPSTGQVFYLKVIQGASNWAVTWFTTITWYTSDFSAPTLPATAGKAILCCFRCTGSNTYDGFVVGASGS